MGFGDVVAMTFVGKACVVAMIAVGIVMIPVQAAAFYNEVSARRVTKGNLPDWRGKPFVLLSTRLTEVRAFSDFFAEFQQALSSSSKFTTSTKLVALCNRPSFEFSAFQELHERALTLVEGSGVSGQDLVAVKAERAKAILLIADRFTTDPEYEDLGILFQVWAAKSYTKTVPLFVQTLKQTTVNQIAPFLDPGQDVAVSTEEIRFRLLSLSAFCPGASTLIGNLIRSSSVRPKEDREETLAGRRWLRQYVDGCEATLCRAPVQRHLVGFPLKYIAEWLFRTSGNAIIGVIHPHGKLELNPSEWVLQMGHTLLVMGSSTKHVRKALAESYVPLSKRTKDQICRWVPDHYPTFPLGWQGSVEKESYCVPIFQGGADSESVDIEDFPCIPEEIAEQMTDQKSLRNFYQEFKTDKKAIKEQSIVGHLTLQTANRLVDQAGLVVDSTVIKHQNNSALDDKTFSNHYIICGHQDSFLRFMGYLRAAEPSQKTIIVILCPEYDSEIATAEELYGPVAFVPGSPTDAESLRKAGAATARALVFLTKGARDIKSAQATGATMEVVRNTREAVLADAPALLACYGVGEESGTVLTHAVVELLFTTSIEFLQPGLLLKGVNSIYDESNVPEGVPRRSWSMRALQQREAVAEGLTEWQANPYYAAGRCTVPALMDTFATQGFFTMGLLIEFLAELSGDFQTKSPAISADSNEEEDPLSTSHPGAMLVQLPLPPGMAGLTFAQCFAALAISRGMILIGLYRKKLENPATRLSYVMTLPPPDEVLERTDRLFVLRHRRSSIPSRYAPSSTTMIP